MISVVCVYNDEESFKRCLLKSLEIQTAKFELIGVDNTKEIFKCASKALNFGGRKAKGKYIAFVHQDVVFYGKYWLEDVEKLLDDIPSLGIAGCAGRTKDGQRQGFMKDRNCLWGKPFAEPEQVQTLDECVLIVPKLVFERFKFDETLPGWHAYGVDYCLVVGQNNLRSYVLPAFIHHDSPTLNVSNFIAAQKKVWIKHRANYPRIFTTCEELHWARFRIPLCIRVVYRRFFPSAQDYGVYLEKILAECKKILFLHWGKDFLMKSRLLPHSIKTESFSSESLLNGKEIFHRYISVEDGKTMRFKESSFDAVILTSEIHENLPDVWVLMEKIERWAKKKVLVIALNEFLEKKESQRELDLENLGFRKLKANQWRSFRQRLDREPVYVKSLNH